MKKYVIGIDVGTTGTKTIVFDKEGNIVGRGYGEYTVQYPYPNWAEQRVDEVMEKTFSVCKMAVKESGVDPKDIEAVGFSTQRATFVLIDENNQPIENTFYSWSDNRGHEIISEAEAIMNPEEYFENTGMPLTPTFTFAKLLWIMKNQRERYDRAKTIALMPDYVQYCFGADDFYSEVTNACTSGYLDPKTLEWSDKVLDAYGIDKNKLPKLINPGEVFGKVSKEVSEKTGLAEGTLLVTGSGDQQCSAIGSGVIKDGNASYNLGTSALLIVGTEKLVLKDVVGVMATSSAALGLFNLEGIQLGAASCYRWMRDEFSEVELSLGSKTGVDPYDLMDHHISKSKIGANNLIFMPYLGGAGYPRWNPEAKGMFAGLTFAHTKSDLTRAVMEGIVLESKDMHETMKAADIKIKQLVITGGATKSKAWCQIMADMFNVPVRKLMVSDSTILGAAILGGLGAGWFKDVPEGVEQFVKYGETITPIEENVKKYNELYEIYRDIYESFNGNQIFKKFAALS